LHKAADDGNLEIVKLLVQRRASLSRYSARGLTALHRAAGRGHVDVIETLLAHGAKVGCKSSDWWTPVHGAASAGRTGVVSFLIGYHEMHYGGGSSRWLDDDFEEIHQGQKLAEIPGGVNFRTRKGWTPLHLACQGAHVDTVEALLSAGASVSVVDKEGDLPLHIAAREGNTGIMEALLRGGERRAGQLECKNLKGWTPLQEAQLSGIYEAEQMLWRLTGLSLESGHGHGDSDSDFGLVSSDAAIRAEKLAKAIRVDDVEAVAGLLGLSDGQERDGEVVHENQALEARNQGGRSPLQQALLFGSLKVAKMLLVSGASVHARSDPGQWSAIHYAALSGNASAVELCLSNGADVHSQTQQGQTPLHHACRRGSEDTARLLLDQGARVDAVDDRDWMPVQVAAAGGHERVVRLLLKEREKDKTARFIDIESIQACAAQGGHHGLVELTRKWRYSWLT
jgi:ankyrin repeat protein